MMRVCTYPDPFNIKESIALWELMTQNPHFCASDTLVQGLSQKYHRTSFGHLRSVATLVDIIYKDWTRNIQKDIKLNLKVSDYIEALPETTPAQIAQKRALKFNKYEIVKAVNILLILDSKKDDFNMDALSYEQRIVFDVYDSLKEDDLTKGLRECAGLSKEKFAEKILETLIDEIKFSFRERPVSELPKTIEETKTFLATERARLINKSQEPLGFGEDDIPIKKNIDEIKHFQKIIAEHGVYDKVIIHGVHKISPIMYRMFKAMEAAGIEVIFVINYMENCHSICETWEKVYAWTGCKFEFVRKYEGFEGTIGASFIDALEGFEAGKHVNQDIIKYPNLTEFTDEISDCYTRAVLKDKNNPLHKMATQYYAVDGESSNRILKIYYPQQFADKHFLSYPIGQFILQLYNMWDEKKQCIAIDFSKLMECINAGLFERANMAKIYRICSDLKIFFQDIKHYQDAESETDDFLQRLAKLKKNKELLDADSRFAVLKYLCFYNVDMADIDLFAKVVKNINAFAAVLFADKRPKYKEHFEKLIKSIQMLAKNAEVSKKELELINEITERLSEDYDDEIEGSVENLKESIHYYLAAATDNNSSNWIVRDFDQIDGGILLSDRKDAVTYNFALLSDNHMCSKKRQDLPFPLTLDMFACAAKADSGVSVYYNTLNEKRNYLKFYLFYGLMFCKKKFKLSFIEKEDDEKQEAYYVLKLLRVNEVAPPPISSTTIPMDVIDVPKAAVSLRKPSVDEQEIYCVCAFKYFLNSCLKAKIVYKSDYNFKYFVRNFMVYFVRKAYEGKLHTEFIDDMKNNRDVQLIRELFPFWLDIEFEDIKRSFEQEFLEEETIVGISAYDENYWRKKRNFLNAQWRDSFNRTMSFEFNEALWRSYMENDKELHEYARDRVPHEKVCSNCNYSELCLRSYYEVRNGFDDLGDS